MAEADRIAARVGEANARAAFFMGHVEALGIGTGTASEQPLTGHRDLDAGRRRRARHLRGRRGGRDRAAGPRPHGRDHDHGRRRDRAGRSRPQLPGGEVLTIPGLRWHTAIDGDTRGQVATQHGIAQAQLEHANGLPAAAPTTAVAAGTLLMIPVHP